MQVATWIPLAPVGAYPGAGGGGAEALQESLTVARRYYIPTFDVAVSG